MQAQNTWWWMTIIGGMVGVILVAGSAIQAGSNLRSFGPGKARALRGK